MTFFRGPCAPLFQLGLAWTIDAFTNQLIISHRLEGSIETTLYRYYWSPAGLSVVFKLTVVETHPFAGYEVCPKLLYYENRAPNDLNEHSLLNLPCTYSWIKEGINYLLLDQGWLRGLLHASLLFFPLRVLPQGGSFLGHLLNFCCQKFHSYIAIVPAECCFSDINLTDIVKPPWLPLGVSLGN